MKRMTTMLVGITMVLMGAALALAHNESGSVQTIKGEVVDLACYLDHGAQGAKHQECAQKCITAGLPVGIKSGDTIYLAIGDEHGPANTALASLAAKQVTVEGKVTERDGVHLIAVKKVTANS